MQTLWKILKIAFYAFFAGVFLYICAQLFFQYYRPQFLEDIYGEYFNKNKLVSENGIPITQFDSLKIIYPDEPQDLEPTRIDMITRQRLINIYEPLIKTDENYNIHPDLALSWGIIDDYNWELRLRSGVKFSDGTDFDSSDTVASINRAMFYSGSQLSDTLNSIASVEVKDSLLLTIKTKRPDPLLLQKLSMVLIIPAEQEKDAILNPVGTAAYKLVESTPGDKMIFEKNDNYWGNTPRFKQVTVFSRPDKLARVRMLLKGEADFLAFVPYDAVQALEKNNFKYTALPSLEVQMLIFNMNSKNFKDKTNREIVSLALDPNALVKSVGGFARTVNQFVSNGIFGYNTKISDHEYDLKKAEELAADSFKKTTVKIHLLAGLDVLGEHIRTQLKLIGIDSIISYLDFPKLLERVKKGDADIYFLSSKSDLGDASTVFEEMFVTGAPFNIGKYSSAKLDYLIGSSLTEMDIKVRRNDLQGAMKIAVTDDVAGIPLLEYETLYGYGSNVEFLKPRIDGLVYFDQLNFIE